MITRFPNLTNTTKHPVIHLLNQIKNMSVISLILGAIGNLLLLALIILAVSIGLT